MRSGNKVVALQNQRRVEIRIVRGVGERDDMRPGRLVVGQGELAGRDVVLGLVIVRAVDGMSGGSGVEEVREHRIVLSGQDRRRLRLEAYDDGRLVGRGQARGPGVGTREARVVNADNRHVAEIGGLLREVVGLGRRSEQRDLRVARGELDGLPRADEGDCACYQRDDGQQRDEPNAPCRLSSFSWSDPGNPVCRVGRALHVELLS